MLTTNSSLMDGINRHILTIAPTINSFQDCEVAVCTVYPRAELNEALEREGVRSFSLNAVSGHDWRIFGAFYKVMREFNPDIIHSHVMALNEKIMLSTIFRSKKYIQTIHGISDKIERETLRMKLDRWLDKTFKIRYDSICVVSNGVRQTIFRGNEKESVYTVYNPILFGEDVPKEYKLHKIINVPEDVPVIGTCCRLAAVKNPPLFTKVMCRVLQMNERTHAVVLGDGDASIKQTLKTIVEKANVSERFHFLGYRQDAPDLIRDLSCFVMTSISEGLPTSLLEAMSNKIPFAMMKGNGGLIDIAELNEKEGPIGIVVDKDDIEAQINGICELINTPSYAKSLIENAFEVGIKYFDTKNVCYKLYCIYKDIYHT